MCVWVDPKCSRGWRECISVDIVVACPEPLPINMGWQPGRSQHLDDTVVPQYRKRGIFVFIWMPRATTLSPVLKAFLRHVSLNKVAKWPKQDSGLSCPFNRWNGGPWPALTICEQAYLFKTSFSLVECFGNKHSVWTLRAWMKIVRNSCGLCSDLCPCMQQASKSIRAKSSKSECGKGPRLKES